MKLLISCVLVKRPDLNLYKYAKIFPNKNERVISTMYIHFCAVLLFALRKNVKITTLENNNT